jgi:hypothetical protein
MAVKQFGKGSQIDFYAGVDQTAQEQEKKASRNQLTH